MTHRRFGAASGLLGVALCAVLSAVASPTHARTPKREPLPVFSVIVPFRPPVRAVPIVNPLSPQAVMELEIRSQPTMPRVENLPLPNGLTMSLDSSLKLRLDLAALWMAQVRQPDTFALTLELQSSAGWLWLTWALPSAKEKQSRLVAKAPFER